MQHLKHLVRGVDVRAAVADLEANPALWDVHTMRTKLYEGSPHKQVSDIWVRYNDWANFNPENPAAFSDEHDPIWYPAYDRLPSLRPLIFNTMAFAYGERLGGVLITRIPPGGEVKPHVDHGWHASYYTKYGISLKAHPGQKFCFEDGEFESAPGDIWEFDNSFLHWVINPTEHERITLIVCVRRRH